MADSSNDYLCHDPPSEYCLGALNLIAACCFTIFVSRQVEMMKELLKGPIAVGIEPGPSFEQYRSGIYEETQAERAARTTGDAHSSSSTEAFEPTGHAVLIVGYGIENGTKYWRVKNSVCPITSCSSIL